MANIHLKTSGIGKSQRFKEVVIRQDAELVHRFEYDKHIVADEGVTIPSYSTSEQTLKSDAFMTPEFELDLDNYSYFVAGRTLTIPEYSVDTRAAGRQEYSLTHFIAEFIKPFTCKAIDDDTTAVTDVKLLVSSDGWTVYWSASGLKAYRTSSYGCNQRQDPIMNLVINDGILKVKSPLMFIRGSTTYFKSVFWDYLTDIRYQYVNEIYRVRNDKLNFDGWSNQQNVQHIARCINSDDHKLT